MHYENKIRPKILLTKYFYDDNYRLYGIPNVVGLFGYSPRPKMRFSLIPDVTCTRGITIFTAVDPKIYDCSEH